VSDNPPLADVERAKQSGIPTPNPQPYEHITVAMVAWNEEQRIRPLLDLLRPRFRTIGVAVQKSTDATLEIASRYADLLVVDEHRGFGDATFGPKLLPQVMTRWTFKLDCDEWPSEELLDSLSWATFAAESADANGVWVPFRSSVEGIEYEEQHAHLRLFETRLGWPGTLHSRPMTDRVVLWPQGYIRHDRTLDEMMQDYLRYWKVGLGNPGWDAHNRTMMYHACKGTAEVKGWDMVMSHPWWPEVEAIAFADERPWL
jgi:hypothetical protein